MNAPHSPLVVIAAVNKANSARVAEKLRNIGSKWRVKLRAHDTASAGNRDVVFASMDAERWKDWMKSMYSIKASDDGEVPVVIADHKVSVYPTSLPSSASWNTFRTLFTTTLMRTVNL